MKLMKIFTLTISMIVVSNVFAKVKKFYECNDSAIKAAPCYIQTTRTSCAGQEATSFKKCGGKATCCYLPKAKDKVTDQASCQAWAQKKCKNRRFDITQKKVNYGFWNQQKMEGGKDYCSSDGNGYTIKDSYPYYNNPAGQCK